MKRWPFHPLLIAAYPILALFARNIDEIKSTAIVRSLSIAIIVTGVVWFFLNLVIKDWRRSAILASFYAILFFFYGHVYHFLEANEILGLSLGRHRLLGVFWLILAVAGTWAALRKANDLPTIQALNVIGMALVAMPVVLMLVYYVRLNTVNTQQAAPQAQEGQAKLQSRPDMPDIYYIVLDAYTRGDVLKEKFHLDNSAFTDELEKMGFYVADCSQSNYGFTKFSITSTLDMDFIDAISARYLGGKMDMIWIPELLRKNEVRQNLEQLGYTTVVFDNNYINLLWNDADVIYRMNPSRFNTEQLFPGVNGFEAMLIRESAALVLTDSLSIFGDRFIPITNLPDNGHRELILYMFEKLKGVPLTVKSPKFVYAHFVAPHFPIVFGPEGGPVILAENADLDTYIAAYRGEVQYLNKRVLEVVREIISTSTTPPVIIIQGDHGDDKATANDRMKILNAYYLPGVDRSKLYPTISPVNSFRLVFNEIFGGNYALLPDKSYFSTLQEPMDYTEIPNPCINVK